MAVLERRGSILSISSFSYLVIVFFFDVDVFISVLFSFVVTLCRMLSTYTHVYVHIFDKKN